MSGADLAPEGCVICRKASLQRISVEAREACGCCRCVGKYSPDPNNRAINGIDTCVASAHVIAFSIQQSADRVIAAIDAAVEVLG